MRIFFKRRNRHKVIGQRSQSDGVVYKEEMGKVRESVPLLPESLFFLAEPLLG
jgi:hypothetical protein